MAVKVMLAPALAQREAAATAPGAKPRDPVDAKPKRRRSSVYDADGNEVFITLMCLKCHKMRPLAQFGLRRMADGAIRNQPWCRTCRSDKGTGTPRRRSSPRAGDAAEAAETAVAAVAQHAEQPVDAGLLAAQVVAALHGGRR